jgi:hypothetical protein
MNQEKLNKLFQLATGKGKAKEEVKKYVNNASRKKADKAKSSYKGYKGSYTDPITAWTRWYEDMKNNIDSSNADDVWSFAEENHPNGREEARNYLREQTKVGGNPTKRESILREQLTKSPSWLVQEKIPELNQVGALVSNQNLVKARKIYASVFEKNLTKLPLQELDPDVPTEVHVNDLLKLELLGSVEVARIVNGRFAVASPDGTVKPAFMLEDPSEIVEMGTVDPSEMDILTNVVPEIATPLIEGALTSIRDMTDVGNRAASGAALQMLKKGMPMDQWGDAFSLIGQNDVDLGMQGLIENNDYDYQDIARLTAESRSMYGGMQ